MVAARAAFLDAGYFTALSAELADAARKEERLAASLSGWFEEVAATRVELPVRLDRAGVRAVVAMGPSARHLAPATLDARLAALAEPVEVTGAVVVHRLVRR